MTLHGLIDRPQELLELIERSLKPKQKEKQEFGEVFTPMYLIFEMLDQLDLHYKKLHDQKSIFSEPNFKWGDIVGCGMGNFSIAVYMRLMEGLKDEIRNVSERKKHILENMIYMAELNRKNAYICRKIFDIKGEYKLNLYIGDALMLDPQKKWKVDKFDIIMGNPPYNKGGIRSKKKSETKTETVWPKFVDKSLLLFFINWYLIDGCSRLSISSVNFSK